MFTWSNCEFVKVIADGQIIQHSALSLWEGEPANNEETNGHNHSRVSTRGSEPGAFLVPGHLQLVVMTKPCRRTSGVPNVMIIESQPRDNWQLAPRNFRSAVMMHIQQDHITPKGFTYLGHAIYLALSSTLEVMCHEKFVLSEGYTTENVLYQNRQKFRISESAHMSQQFFFQQNINRRIGVCPCVFDRSIWLFHNTSWMVTMICTVDIQSVFTHHKPYRSPMWRCNIYLFVR